MIMLRAARARVVRTASQTSILMLPLGAVQTVKFLGHDITLLLHMLRQLECVVSLLMK